MFAISFHLIHGFESAFQTLGLSHKKYNALIKNIGLAFSIIIPAAFASIPVIMYFK
jgi:succinate dehydrogenase / fumarate reductase cytochrome b subunit